MLKNTTQWRKAKDLNNKLQPHWKDIILDKNNKKCTHTHKKGYVETLEQKIHRSQLR